MVKHDDRYIIRPGIQKKTSEEDHVYLNIVIANTSTTELQIAEYSAPRTTPLLNNPSDYYLTVQRFTVPLQQVPIFVFLDNTYSVTISYNGTDYQTILTYVPGYTPILNPSSPENRYVYSYNQFIDSINNGLGDSMTAFTAALPLYSNVTVYSAGQAVRFNLAGVDVAYSSINSGNVGNTPNTSPTFWAPLTTPYLEYNPVTKLIRLIASRGYHNVNFSDENQPLKIWFNTDLWNFFSNFEKIYNGNTPAPYNANGKNYNIIIKPTGNNDVIIPAIFEDFGMDIQGYAMSQEFISLYNWNSMRNIVFVTSTIPIRSEAIPSQSGIASPFVTNATTASAFRPILTDFQLLVNEGPEARSYAQYFPSGEYRLVDVTGTNPLVNIDLKVYWQDKFQNLYPIYINPLDTLDIKILFRKKSIKGNLSYYN